MVTSIQSLPTIAAYTSDSAPVAHVCAEGYSGWLGVVSSGVQVGSGCVAGLPSLAALRIAVTGRQNA
jgi:hypothetical protein